MRYHAAHLLDNQDQADFTIICYQINSLPDHIDLGKDEEGSEIELSCHILARAVAHTIFGYTAVDGKYLDLMEHSWVETPNGNIVDVYPVAGLGGPRLIDAKNSFIFKKKEFVQLSGEAWQDRYEKRFIAPSFKDAVEKVFYLLMDGLPKS